MSTAKLRNQINNFRRKCRNLNWERVGKGYQYNVAKYIISPDDRLLLEFINSLTFDQLYKNTIFKERLTARLKELETQNNS